jgi:hypothetical protein
LFLPILLQSSLLYVRTCMSDTTDEGSPNEDNNGIEQNGNES